MAFQTIVQGAVTFPVLLRVHQCIAAMTVVCYSAGEVQLSGRHLENDG